MWTQPSEGSRLHADYPANGVLIPRRYTSCGLSQEFVACAWGDPLGVEFEGKSLPPQNAARTRTQPFDDEDARWTWLLGDPFIELVLLSMPDKSAVNVGSPSQMPAWQQLWKRIAAYEVTLELQLLLERGGLVDVWHRSWSTVINSHVAQAAFEASTGELPEASRALARCAVAQLHIDAVTSNLSGPNARVREKIVERLLVDWGQQVYGITDIFLGVIKQSGTRFLRNRRHLLCETAALVIGDILLYQSKGDLIRKFIRTKIENAASPVTLIGHSLGGVACADLLALPNPPAVSHFITAGSQSSFFTEIGASHAFKLGDGLPDGFPPWLNIYDENDFLSFCCEPIFPQACDQEIPSGHPFPDSHSAYFSSEVFWTEIRSFIAAGTRCRT